MKTTKDSPEKIEIREGPSAVFWFWWSGFLLWLVAVFVVSSIPASRIVEAPFFSADKVAHFGLFLVGAAFLAGALRSTLGWTSARIFFVAILVMLALGVLDEIHQLWTPGRQGGDWGDIVADTLGSAAGVLFEIFFIYGIQRRRKAEGRGAPGADRAA